MCLIIDKNVIPDFSCTPPHERAAPVINSINKNRIQIAFGGKNADELFDTPIRRWLTEQWRRGGAIIYDKVEIEQEEKVISRLCKSNDRHVIALARISGARVLYSRDKDLHCDFTNKNLVNNPRGAIYNSPKHTHLLMESPRCRRQKS